ncbi:hypothetical protein PQX77_022375 [Marasmius sp. AFHP31]|nr:hypothetical protein PQX77_022375 [Marasmius sp. AFHP31]
MSPQELDSLETRTRGPGGKNKKAGKNVAEDHRGNGLQLDELSVTLLQEDFGGFLGPDIENDTSTSDEDSSTGRDERSSSKDNSSSSEDDSSSQDNSRYGEDDGRHGEENPHPARNLFVEESLDRVQEMLEFIRKYDFEEERKQMSEEAWEAFMDPPQERVELPPMVRLSIQYYLILSHSPENTYARFRKLYNETHPAHEQLLSYDQVRRRLRTITGIYALRIDKCKNNCLAFIGPWGTLSVCSGCGEERYDDKGKPRSQFVVIPLAPQLQAQYRHPEWAAKLRYRQQQTRRILEEGSLDWSDVLHGSDYLRLVEGGEVDENTMVLMFSEDSAQLYRDKDSSTLFGIAISADLAPDVRHLENSVIPLFVVGGPNAAQHDSFSLLTLAHLAACQRRGFKVWDCLRDELITKYPFLLHALADTVAMTDMSKSVGHHGRNGCRLLCNMPGRHKPGVGTYYPALLRPDGQVPRPVPEASAHPDVHPDTVTSPTVKDYQDRLQLVMDSPNATQYKKRRRETGIRGPSLFSTLPKALPCPKLFPADLMHLYLNLNQLILQLWKGDIEYKGDENPGDWPFAILHDPDMFDSFGLAVERACRYIPTCVETRIPRNPAKKVNTQYKATEYHMLIFGLCPGLLYGRMPDYLYRHFSQLVSATRVVLRRRKTLEELREARKNLVEFVILFEQYYYRRKIDCLHFVRPCIHALLHIVEELIRVGSLTELSQWTTETTISHYERRLRLHSNPYGNLGVEVAEQAVTNAVYAIDPTLRVTLDSSDSSTYAQDVGSGYTSLHPRDDHLMDIEAACALKKFCEACEWHEQAEQINEESPPVVKRFARLLLPNRQAARSKWQEGKREDDVVRQARNVKVSIGNTTCFAEVLYYFNIAKRGIRYTLAMIKLFSPPDEEVLDKSLRVLHVCRKQGTLTVVDAKWITEVIAMVPFRPPTVAWNEGETDQYFVVEKIFSNLVNTQENDN